jgi:hypothetical protein
MANTMSEFKTTANDHLRRDMEAGGKWVCACEACHEIRSLMGMDKMLAMRPLVRQLQAAKEQLETLPDGPEKRIALEQYLALHDRLASEMVK